MTTHHDFAVRNNQSRPGIRYESGLTIYDEALIDGHWVGRYWSSIGRVQPDVEPPPDGAPPRELDPPSLLDRSAFGLAIDGVELAGGWAWGGATEVIEPAGQTGRRRGRHVVVELQHRQRPVSVRVHTQLDGSPVLTRWLDIENHSDQTVSLTRLAGWSGVIWRVPNYLAYVPEAEGSAFAVGYYASGMWAYEGDFAWESLSNGVKRIEATLGHSGWGRPVAILGNEPYGEMFSAELAWSGNWTIAVDCRQEQRFHADRRYGPLPEARLQLSIGPSCADPVLRVIEGGEVLATPAVHLGRYHGDLDQVTQALHEHARRSVLAPSIEGRPQPVIYNAAVYPNDWSSEADLKRHVDIAVRNGAEQFIIDAGWYGREPGIWHDNVGDWHEGPWLPNGLRVVREYARTRGLPFGLWVEIESIGPNSRLLAEHPDWVMTRHGQPAGIHQAVIGRALDLSQPAVARFVESELIRLIETHDLDLLRLDYNSMPLAGGTREVAGFVENTIWRHVETIYGIVDRLRTRFPRLIIENCSEGGGRTDLGMMARCHTTWISDWMNLPRSVQILNGMTVTLPPEVCNRLFALVAGDFASPGSLPAQLRLPLFGHPCYCALEPLADSVNPITSEAIRASIALYQQFVRPFLANAKVYHHTPVTPNNQLNGWNVLEYVAADRSRAMVGLFRLNPVGSNEFQLKLRGLDPGRPYLVHLDNAAASFERDGLELGQTGLTVRLDRALASELIRFEAI